MEYDDSDEEDVEIVETFNYENVRSDEHGGDTGRMIKSSSHPQQRANRTPEKSDPCESNIPLQYLEFLEKHFGHTLFREMQWKIIRSILYEAKDNLAVMATGYGKSLCFQFPSVYWDKITIVVSPLISLMEDQVHLLGVTKIKACLLGTAQKDRSVIDKVAKMEYNIVYVTPEYITSENGLLLLDKIRSKLILIAIDEAHCISKWGHNFRVAFRKLKCIRCNFPTVPILAVTATATEPVQRDIIESLGLQDPQVLCTGFDRPNLEFILLPKSSDVWSDIGTFLKSVDNGSTIVYCISRKCTEKITAEISKHYNTCKAYHAGLSQDIRKEVYQDFVNDRVRVIVATIAFGMGIDKPDVRLVIHYGVSKDLESFYQEVGRAGRDGLPSKCVMFHSRADWTLHQIQRENSFLSSDLKTHLEKLSTVMVQYIQTTECRRKFILKYFGDKNVSHLKSHRNCCDNCRKKSQEIDFCKIYEGIDEEGKLDITTDSCHLLTAIKDMGGKFGVNKPILLLRGSRCQGVPAKYHSHPFYGVGKAKKIDWYKLIADFLQTKGYLKKTLQKSSVFTSMQNTGLTDMAHDWLAKPDRPAIKIVPHSEMIKMLKPKFSIVHQNRPVMNKCQESQNQNLSHVIASNAASDDGNQKIMKALFKVRSDLSSRWDVMPYAVASNTAMRQMATLKPRDLTELKNCKLDGFSEAKITNFGSAFVACICTCLQLEPLHNSTHQPDKQKISPGTSEPSSISLSAMHQQVLKLWRNTEDVGRIVKSTKLSSSIIAILLAELIENGLIGNDDDLKRLGITESNINQVANIPNCTEHNVEELVNSIPPGMSFDMLRYCLSVCRLRKQQKLNCNSLERNYQINVVLKSEEGNSNQYLPSQLKSTDENANSQQTVIPTGSPESADSFWRKDSNDQNLSQLGDIIENHVKNSGDENDELKLLLEDIKREDLFAVESKSESIRPRNLRPKKKSLVYVLDSSDDEVPVVLPAKKKRILPGWMSRANS